MNKKIMYSKLFLLCVAIFIISLPISYFIKNTTILLTINLVLKILSLIFVIYYSKKERFEKLEFSKVSKYHLILMPFILLTFSNIFVVIFNQISINSNIHILNFILELFGVILTAIIEEIIFRHFLYKEFIKKYSILKSILFTSLIFGALHLLNISSFASIPYCLVQSLYTFGIGIILSIIYIFSKNIIYPIIYHFLFNFINGVLITYLFNIPWDLSFFLINIILGIMVGLYALFVYKRYLMIQEVSEYVS